MFYVYVIESGLDLTRYIGFTKNLDQRIKDHNLGKSKYTKSKLPWKLIYAEIYHDESKARKRELKLKKSSWHKKQLFDRLFTN